MLDVGGQARGHTCVENTGHYYNGNFVTSTLHYYNGNLVTSIPHYYNGNLVTSTLHYYNGNLASLERSPQTKSLCERYIP